MCCCEDLRDREENELQLADVEAEAEGDGLRREDGEAEHHSPEACRPFSMVLRPATPPERPWLESAMSGREREEEEGGAV